MFINNEIKQMRRDGMSKEEKYRLIKEDQREERELRNLVVQSLTSDLEKAIKNNKAGNTPSRSRGSDDEIKLPTRTTGTEQWRRVRGENGPAPGGPGNEQPRREGQ